MLLRRMIEHVKAQNWFAVGLDFFIVVTGVFIGLQALTPKESLNRSGRFLRSSNKARPDSALLYQPQGVSNDRICGTWDK
jgi:hypothetical protein